MSNRRIGIILTSIAVALILVGVFLFYSASTDTVGSMASGGIIGIVSLAVGAILLVFGAIGIGVSGKPKR